MSQAMVSASARTRLFRHDPPAATAVKDKALRCTRGWPWTASTREHHVATMAPARKDLLPDIQADVALRHRVIDELVRRSSSDA
jgi:hypothetical protein